MNRLKAVKYCLDKQNACRLLPQKNITISLKVFSLSASSIENADSNTIDDVILLFPRGKNQENSQWWRNPPFVLLVTSLLLY